MKDMMMKKKEKSNLDNEAKKASIMELLDLARSMMKDKVSSDMSEMKKVTVAAPSTDKLLEGLEKAEEIVEESPEISDLDDSVEEYADLKDEEDEDEEEDYA